MGIINKIKFAILPVIGLPILFAIGSKNYYRTIAVFISIIVLLMYARLSITSRNSQSKFFLSWTISSVIYLWILSVLTTIQTDDGLQREHYALASITFGAMLFFRLVNLLWKIRFIQSKSILKCWMFLFFFHPLKGKTKSKKKDISYWRRWVARCYLLHTPCNVFGMSSLFYFIGTFDLYRLSAIDGTMETLFGLVELLYYWKESPFSASWTHICSGCLFVWCWFNDHYRLSAKL